VNVKIEMNSLLRYNRRWWRDTRETINITSLVPNTKLFLFQFRRSAMLLHCGVSDTYILRVCLN